MPFTDSPQDDVELIIRRKDEELAAAKDKIEDLDQQVADQKMVIDAQQAFIAKLVEMTTYHSQRIEEFEARMEVQENRADELERKAEDLAQQVDWIRRRLFGLNDYRDAGDFIC